MKKLVIGLLLYASTSFSAQAGQLPEPPDFTKGWKKIVEAKCSPSPEVTFRQQGWQFENSRRFYVMWKNDVRIAQEDFRATKGEVTFDELQILKNGEPLILDLTNDAATDTELETLIGMSLEKFTECLK